MGQNPNLDENLAKSEIQKFQNGGSLIPSGALHKNKHKIVRYIMLSWKEK